jgi:hypothetical protein
MRVRCPSGRSERYGVGVTDPSEPVEPAPSPSPADAPQAQPPAILASDAEREGAVTILRDAVGEGRLTLEEFSHRVGLAQQARTDRELAVLSADLPAAPAAGELATEPEEHRALCSHLTRSGPWSLPQRSSWRSIFGTIDLDLRQARLSGSDNELRVHNVFGTVTVIAPEGLEVIVRGGGMFASQKIESPAQPPVPGGPRLIIETSGPGGTLYVRSRPPLKTTLKSLLKG